MKVALCDDSHTFGGAQVALIRLAVALAEVEKIQVYLAAGSFRLFSDISLEDKIRVYKGIHGKPFPLVSSYLNLTARKQARDFFEFVRPDFVLINCSGLEFGINYLRAAEDCGLRYSRWLHNSAPLENMYHGNSLVRRTFYRIRDDIVNRIEKKRLDPIFCVSMRSLKELNSRGIDLDRISVLPNVAPEKQFLGVDENLLEWKNCSKLIACIGRIEFGTKGQDQLAEAVSILVQRGYDLKVVFIGSGNDLPVLRSIVRNLQLEGRVQHFDWMKNPFEKLKGCDLLVIPSRTESFGLVALESIIAGLPVIASDVGAHSEFLEKEDLFVPGDLNGLVLKLSEKLSKDSQAPSVKQVFKYRKSVVAEGLIKRISHEVE